MKGPLRNSKGDLAASYLQQGNLDRIDANMIALAKKLQVEPRKLLSHVLEYHLMI